MGRLCDFCGDQRSMVYCRSDVASLCLSCDRNVHSANALSRRHSRTLLCDRCYSQPATVRCIAESISLCHTCDWNGHNSMSSSGHKRQTLSCYSGCPLAIELAKIWSFAMEFSSLTNPIYEHGMGLMSINENNASTYWGSSPNSCNADKEGISKINTLDNMNKNMHIDSSTSTPTFMTCNVDQEEGSIDSTSPKPCDTGMKDAGIVKDDLYDNYTVDDVDLTFEDYEELFGSSHTHSEKLFDDVRIDNFLEMDSSTDNHNSPSQLITEVKSSKPECSNALSVDCNSVTRTDSTMSILPKQARSGPCHSFSLTGESSCSDYQECGMSSMPIVGEPPWYPPCSESSIQVANRDNAVMRYKEKKKIRKFEKKIRYASRKTRADSRKRVKGRFIKVGEAYDYDPFCQTRSF